MNNTRRKVDLYMLSLGLLFVFFLIISVNLPPLPFEYTCFEYWKTLIEGNLLAIASALALLYSLFAYYRFKFDLEGATDVPFKLTKVADINYEHLTFLATYVVPLISFDFTIGRQLIVLGLLLLVMGAIYIKTDLFYANPSLALLGFRIYRVDGSFKTGSREGVVVISRERLFEGQYVNYIKLDERIYFARGARE